MPKYTSTYYPPAFDTANSSGKSLDLECLLSGWSRRLVISWSLSTFTLSVTVVLFLSLEKDSADKLLFIGKGFRWEMLGLVLLVMKNYLVGWVVARSTLV